MKDAACLLQRNEATNRLLKQIKEVQDAAQADVAAAKAEAFAAKAGMSAAQGKAATFATRLQELQHFADLGSEVSVHMCQCSQPACTHRPRCMCPDLRHDNLIDFLSREVQVKPAYVGCAYCIIE